MTAASKHGTYYLPFTTFTKKRVIKNAFQNNF